MKKNLEISGNVKYVISSKKSDINNIVKKKKIS